VLYDAEGTSTEILIGGRNLASIVLWSPNCHSKTPQAICSRAAAAGWTSRTSNLLATLLVHAQYRGYWNQLGMQFQEEMEALLQRHVLSGLVDAPWVRTDDPESDDDDGFFAALQELLRTLLKRVSVSRRKVASFLAGTRLPVRFISRILQEVQSLLQKYRSELGQAISPARSRRSAVIRAHQPGSEPIDIPEDDSQSVVIPKPTPTPTEPAPKAPVRIPFPSAATIYEVSPAQRINAVLCPSLSKPDSCSLSPSGERPERKGNPSLRHDAF